MGSHPQLAAHVEALLVEAADGDPDLLQQLRKRVISGEPAAYVVGHCSFLGRRFLMDRRAYVTDPELKYLLYSVIERGDPLFSKLNRPLRVVEFGVGAGTLALTLKHERPEWHITGLDVDAQALNLARENATLHGLEVALIQSDFLSAWPESEPPPDLLFGDPPWGSTEDLYDADRNASYYEHMPRHSVYPESTSRTGVHDELIEQVLLRDWKTELLLNYGILSKEEIERSCQKLSNYEILNPTPGLSILHRSESIRSCESLKKSGEPSPGSTAMEN